MMTETLKNLFHDIMLDGSATLPKKRLLWILGWGQDRPSAWTELQERWKEMATGHDLAVAIVWQNVILTMARDAQFQPLQKLTQAEAEVA
jgi:hypothetical protein